VHRAVKTAEPIEMPFGSWAPVGSANHVLDGCPDPNARGAILGERTFPSKTHFRELCPLGCGLGWVLLRNHVLRGGAHWRNMANTIEPSMFE